MHTMVVEMSVDPARAGEVARHFRDDVAVWARRQPGFVSGQWLLTGDRSGGLGAVVFTSEAQATAAAEGPRRYPRDEARAWNIETVTVYEQLTAV